jgi:hypothetical protein
MGPDYSEGMSSRDDKLNEIDERPPDGLIERPASEVDQVTPAPIRDQLVAQLDELNAAVESPIANAALQAALSVMGPVGAGVGGWLSGRATQLMQKNSLRALRTILDYARQLDEAKIDRQFLDSDEFTSLLIDVLTMNAKTYEEEKVDLFSRVFINSMLGEQVNVPYKEGFLKIIGDLSTDHIRVFRFICERTKNPDPNEAELTVGRVLSSEIASATGLPEHRAMAYGYELVRYGLLIDWGIGRYGYKPGAFALTEYGEEFAAFLRDPRKIRIRNGMPAPGFEPGTN